MGAASSPIHYLVKLKKRSEVAERTIAFAFE